MSWPARLAWAALAVGLLAGSLGDPTPPTPVVERLGRRVLQVDLHAHTRFSDGVVSPVDLVPIARRAGLDAFAVTEHNLVFPALVARWYSELVGGPIVLVGEEITTRAVHVIALGIEERIPWNQPLPDVIEAIHRQGGVAIGAHPFGRFGRALAPVRDRLDAVEVVHPLAWVEPGENGRAQEMRSFYEQARADGYSLAAVGSSDYHAFGVMGLVRVWVAVDEVSARGIVEGIREGRTAVRDVDGRWWGSPDLVATMERDPPAIPSFAPGPVEQVFAVLGWLGLVGIVVFGAGRASSGVPGTPG